MVIITPFFSFFLMDTQVSSLRMCGCHGSSCREFGHVACPDILALESSPAAVSALSGHCLPPSGEVKGALIRSLTHRIHQRLVTFTVFEQL